MITLVAAMAPNRVIGNGPNIPWHISEDFKQYKEYTMGKPLIMGRSTLESIGRPLPGRRNIMLTRKLPTSGKMYDFWKDGKIEIYTSPEQALDSCREEKEIIINGGAQIYGIFLPLADGMRLSHVHGDFEWDVFFPEFDISFQEVDREKREEFDIVTYTKKSHDS